MNLEHLTGKFEEFMEWSKKDSAQKDERFDGLEKKVDALHGFKMKIIGGAIAIGFIVSTVIGIAQVIAGR